MQPRICWKQAPKNWKPCTLKLRFDIGLHVHVVRNRRLYARNLLEFTGIDKISIDIHISYCNFKWLRRIGDDDYNLLDIAI